MHAIKKYPVAIPAIACGIRCKNKGILAIMFNSEEKYCGHIYEIIGMNTIYRIGTPIANNFTQSYCHFPSFLHSHITLGIARNKPKTNGITILAIMIS
ncbi:hypothetical protein BHU72_12125 [Desulfuribacillus stibiiarsenatis]|uniref:Uncharacterized protein n=1 Tax=Desulfuribacillus stibiiarsenatis TaxID=1390249 RepID=A0A1E5L1Z5_9FIRM|nr:hypothetical protein BHU72_12125 [Desulfuribacillus stibiiarsenatis]